MGCCEARARHDRLHQQTNKRNTENNILVSNRRISHFCQIAPKICTLDVVRSWMWVSPENCRGFTSCSWPQCWDAAMGHPKTHSMGAAGSRAQHPARTRPRLRDVSSTPRESVFCLVLAPLVFLLSFFMDSVPSLPPRCCGSLLGCWVPFQPRTCDISMATERDVKLHGWHEK